jgi:hypothetical protein
MHLVPNRQKDPKKKKKQPPSLAGVPLSVVFAEGDAIEAVRERGKGPIALEPPFHVSDEDAYLVLPDDIGMEIVDIVSDGDLDLLRESLRDGLVVRGSVAKDDDGRQVLEASEAHTPASLVETLEPSAEVVIGAGSDPIAEANELPALRCTVASRFIDDDGLERVLRRAEYLGISWSPSADGELSGVDPTYVWSRRQTGGRVCVELALFLEYEELVVVLRPVAFVAG